MTAAAKTQRQTFPKTIEIEITEEDNTLRMKQHLEVEFNIDAVKAKRAAATGQFSEELKSLQRQRSDLINTIQSMKEKRDILCYQEPDFRRNMMITRRDDTDEVIDERALTLEERQETLPLKAKTPEQQAADAAGDAAEEGDAPPDTQRPASEAPKGAGKVVRIRASDAKKRKASRAKAKADE